MISQCQESQVILVSAASKGMYRDKDIIDIAMSCKSSVGFAACVQL